MRLAVIPTSVRIRGVSNRYAGRAIFAMQPAKHGYDTVSMPFGGAAGAKSPPLRQQDRGFSTRRTEPFTPNTHFRSSRVGRVPVMGQVWFSDLTWSLSVSARSRNGEKRDP